MTQRPSDPSQIKFTDDCFVKVSEEVEYSRAYRPGQIGYSRALTAVEATQLIESGRAHEVAIHRRPVMKRIKWQ